MHSTQSINRNRLASIVLYTFQRSILSTALTETVFGSQKNIEKHMLGTYPRVPSSNAAKQLVVHPS